MAESIKNMILEGRVVEAQQILRAVASATADQKREILILYTQLFTNDRSSEMAANLLESITASRMGFREIMETPRTDAITWPLESENIINGARIRNPRFADIDEEALKVTHLMLGIAGQTKSVIDAERARQHCYACLPELSEVLKTDFPLALENSEAGLALLDAEFSRLAAGWKTESMLRICSESIDVMRKGGVLEVIADERVRIRIEEAMNLWVEAQKNPFKNQHLSLRVPPNMSPEEGQESIGRKLVEKGSNALIFASGGLRVGAQMTWFPHLRKIQINKNQTQAMQGQLEVFMMHELVHALQDNDLLRISQECWEKHCNNELKTGSGGKRPYDVRKESEAVWVEATLWKALIEKGILDPEIATKNRHVKNLLQIHSMHQEHEWSSEMRCPRSFPAALVAMTRTHDQLKQITQNFLISKPDGTFEEYRES